jgi:hypothetical protein
VRGITNLPTIEWSARMGVGGSLLAFSVQLEGKAGAERSVFQWKDRR